MIKSRQKNRPKNPPGRPAHRRVMVAGRLQWVEDWGWRDRALRAYMEWGSLRRAAAELTRSGYPVSHARVWQLVRTYGLVLPLKHRTRRWREEPWSRPPKKRRNK